jgi:hypothetical protein
MGVSFLSIIMPWFGLNFDYALWGNIGGFSLITDVLFFYIFFYGKYCLLVKMLPLGMFLANLINIWGVFYPKYYYFWYEIVIFSVILTALIIYELHKRIFK